MPLVEYYNQPQGSNHISDEASLYKKKHVFNLSINENSITEDERKAFISFNFKDQKILETKTIEGIVEELPQISYSTTWGDSPVATIADKIKKFSEHKVIKMFAQQNPNYRPPLITDGWSQQFPKEAAPLSINIKFRAYPFLNRLYDATNYNDIIRFLIFATTPKDYNIHDSVAYLGIAQDQAEMKGKELSDLVDDFYVALNENKNSSLIGELSKDLKNYVDDKRIETSNESYMFKPSHVSSLTAAVGAILNYFDNLANMNDNDVGGIPGLRFNIRGYIKESDFNWIIKSWSFKPALNVTDLNNPIYVDFNLSLSTQQVLTNDDIKDLII